MLKPRKTVARPNWQKILRNDRDFYKNLCEMQSQKIAEMQKQLDFALRIANGPPTIMISCEHLVDAAAQSLTQMNSFVNFLSKAPTMEKKSWKE